ncbi:hypothetical protein EDD68_1151, partial [Melghiribacillus thermohalophilus]
ATILLEFITNINKPMQMKEKIYDKRLILFFILSPFKTFADNFTKNTKILKFIYTLLKIAGTPCSNHLTFKSTDMITRKPRQVNDSTRFYNV